MTLLPGYVVGVASEWDSVGIAFAGVALGALLGFVLAELSGYFGRKRETRAAARVVFGELVANYTNADAVARGLVEKPDEIELRRTAWEAHGPAVSRALSLEKVYRVAAAYSALDNLRLVLRADAPAEVFRAGSERDWLEKNVLADLEHGMVVVGGLIESEATIRARVETAQRDRAGSESAT